MTDSLQDFMDAIEAAQEILRSIAIGPRAQAHMLKATDYLKAFTVEVKIAEAEQKLELLHYTTAYEEDLLAILKLHREAPGHE